MKSKHILSLYTAVAESIIQGKVICSRMPLGSTAANSCCCMTAVLAVRASPEVSLTPKLRAAIRDIAGRNIVAVRRSDEPSASCSGDCTAVTAV